MTDQLTRESADDVVRLSSRLDSLHQLLYTRGGIRPSNAAVEELSKLLLLRIAATRYPSIEVEGFGSIRLAMETARSGSDGAVVAAKAAFRSANSSPHLVALLPNGATQTIEFSRRLCRPSRQGLIALA